MEPRRGTAQEPNVLHVMSTSCFSRQNLGRAQVPWIPRFHPYRDVLPLSPLLPLAFFFSSFLLVSFFLDRLLANADAALPSHSWICWLSLLTLLVLYNVLHGYIDCLSYLALEFGNFDYHGR